LDKVIAAGANHLNNVSFELSDRTGPADAALKEAVADATRRAGLMADAGGLKLVRLQSLVMGEAAGRPVPFAAAMQMAKVATPIMAGQQEITANVTAIFEVAPK